MPTLKKKELDKFIKDNPDNPAAIAIKQQLQEYDQRSDPDPVPTPNSTLSETRMSQIEVLDDDQIDINKLKYLHSQLIQHGNEAFAIMVQMGEILSAKKEKAGKRKWCYFVRSHLPISVKQSNRYITIYEYRDELQEVLPSLITSGEQRSMRKMLKIIRQNHPQPKPTRKLLPTPETPEPEKEERAEIETLQKKESDTIAHRYQHHDGSDQAVEDMSKKENYEHSETPIDLSELKSNLYDRMPDIFASEKQSINILVDESLYTKFKDQGGTLEKIEAIVNRYLENVLTEEE